MDFSDSYLVIERMLREGTLKRSKLEDLLVTLESQGMITPAEHQALLDLAEGLKIDSASIS